MLRYINELTSCYCWRLIRYQEDLPPLVSARSPPHLTHEELARLMKWKLTVSIIMIEAIAS